MRRHLTYTALSLIFVFGTLGVGSATSITNGDFERGDLSGFFTEDDSGDSNPDINVVTDPDTGNHFAKVSPSGASFFNTLGQLFTIPSVPGLPTRLSFDFAFSTEGIPPSGGPFDSFAVSLFETQIGGDFLDILVVDALGGVIPDPSDGIEPPGTLPIDVAYDASISIPGFVPFAGGTTFSGRISLFLPSVVLGEEATILFDMFDNDGFQTIAAVDNIAVEPVPEPSTMILLGSGLVGLIGWGRRKFSILA